MINDMSNIEDWCEAVYKEIPDFLLRKTLFLGEGLSEISILKVKVSALPNTFDMSDKVRSALITEISNRSVDYGSHNN